MASLNRVQLLGSLADNPELRYTPSRKGVASFILQVEGEAENTFPIYVWGKLAEQCNEHLKKGSRVYLEGKLLIKDKTIISTTSTFDGEEIEIEEDRYSVQVVAKRVEFLDNQQLDSSASENRETIEIVIRVLESLAMDPMADHKMILNLVDELNSLDLENID